MGLTVDAKPGKPRLFHAKGATVLTRTCHGRLQSGDQLWYEGARLLGEREGTCGSPEEPA
jgi:hypothetical protein